MIRIRDTTVNASQGFWVIDDKSKAKITGRSFRHLKQCIIDHRKGNDLEWSHHEVEDMIHRQVCEREAPKYCRDQDGNYNVKAQPAHDSWGSRAWKDLHIAALKGDLNLEWLKTWERRIPIGQCACRKHWKNVKAECPFEPTFEWSWRAHEAVNRMLGKKGVTLEKALEIWSNN